MTTTRDHHFQIDNQTGSLCCATMTPTMAREFPSSLDFSSDHMG